ncbi:unnamed protein product [Urochloa humidicola]
MVSGCGGGQLWKRGSRKPRRGILDLFNLNRTPTGSEGAMALRNRGYLAVHTNAAPQQLQHNEGVSYLHNGSECQGGRLMMRATAKGPFMLRLKNQLQSTAASTLQEMAPTSSE